MYATFSRRKRARLIIWGCAVQIHGNMSSRGFDGIEPTTQEFRKVGIQRDYSKQGDMYFKKWGFFGIFDVFL